MHFTDLTLPQLQTLLDRTLDDLSHYAQLRQRMKERGFAGDDALVVAVDRVHVQLQDLRMMLHYEVTRRGGTGERTS
jgi:hypothetical protein